ncbi:MAG: GTPase Era [Parcubacteria group bacterium]|nr:GTPase Era [Parcubacteria group bacterium]
MKNTRSGFVVMIGRSNVGKSTLMNSIIGSKIAITTPKPQTTRLPIQGILTRENTQIIFVDTPGILKGAKDLLSKKLAKSVHDSLEEVDAVVYVVDPTRQIGQEEREVMRLIESIDKPSILVINKMDLDRKPYLDFYRDLAENYTDTVELSALHNRHVGTLVEKLQDLLPEGVFYYPEGQLTNMPNKYWLAELVREKLFLRLRQELPYSTHVEVSDLEERADGMMYIKATIFTTTERYKRMIIGAGGRGVKEIGQSVRKELEAVMETKVFIDLRVEVDEHWMKRFV